MVDIVEARFPEDRDTVSGLFRAYEASLGVDLCFQGFAGELEGLPGAYAPPDGALFLAMDAGRAIGCGALKRHDASTAEMKRVYLDPSGRGKGTGRALVEAILAAARTKGYTLICLDTLPHLHEAQALYRKLGFVEISRYNDNPLPGVLFFGKHL